MLQNMLVTILCVFCIISLLNGALVNKKETTKLVNKRVSILSNKHKLPFNSLTSIFKTLKLLNRPPLYKRKAGPRVCLIQSNKAVELLVKTLKLRLTRTRKICLIRPITTQTTARLCHRDCCNRKSFTTINKRRINNKVYCHPEWLCNGIQKYKKKLPRKKLLRGTVIVPMTPDEIAVLQELNIASIPNARASKVKCIGRGYVTEIDTLNLCHSCKYSITLPPSHYPQFHAHYTCGIGANSGCLSYLGTCSKIVRSQYVKVEDASGISLDLTTFCACEVVNGSPLEPFV